MHITYEEAAGFLEGIQTGPAHILDAAGAQPCPICCEKISRLQMIIEVTASDQTIAPPPVVLRRAINNCQKRFGPNG